MAKSLLVGVRLEMGKSAGGLWEEEGGARLASTEELWMLRVPTPARGLLLLLLVWSVAEAVLSLLLLLLLSWMTWL